MPPIPESPRRAGAAVYSSFVLALYDAWVLGFSNRFAWQCPTREVLLPFFRKHAGRRHLDVGVGTGWYLAHAHTPASYDVALLDLNPNCLHAAAHRMERPNDGLFQADVLASTAPLQGRRFDAISLFYLLHCLPGPMAAKAAAFANLKQHLAADGVLYGATILGDEAGHNALGRLLMKTYNRKGIFSNGGDTVEALRDALSLHFQDVEITERGKVALFAARQPR